MGRRLNIPKSEDKAVLSLRIDFAHGKRLGPGKVRLLESIAETGSISGAGRAIGMSYKRAWDLLEELNTMFVGPVIESHIGGSRGGGAVLTVLGQDIITLYRRMEKQSATASNATLAKMMQQTQKR